MGPRFGKVCLRLVEGGRRAVSQGMPAREGEGSCDCLARGRIGLGEGDRIVAAGILEIREVVGSFAAQEACRIDLAVVGRLEELWVVVSVVGWKEEGALEKTVRGKNC